MMENFTHFSKSEKFFLVTFSFVIFQDFMCLQKFSVKFEAKLQNLFEG